MDPHRRVVSIVGMGGLGKTTLAKKLYNHCDITKQFDCKAFVYVSNDYSRRDTLQGIIAATIPNCNMEDLTKLAEEALVLKLYELLKERRYLVVLDDIWQKEVWDSMQSAFPRGKMGKSRKTDDGEMRWSATSSGSAGRIIVHEKEDRRGMETRASKHRLTPD
ncbi:hypothetical protein GBA52_027266 [Prunus armeniaca]|nr:hypothetical protein GBA52_027266 [Prunus armeniaca]